VKTTPKYQLIRKFSHLSGLRYYLDNAIELTKMLRDYDNQCVDWKMIILSAKVDRDFDNGVLERMPPHKFLLPVVRYMRKNNIILQ